MRKYKIYIYNYIYIMEDTKINSELKIDNSLNACVCNLSTYMTKNKCLIFGSIVFLLLIIIMFYINKNYNVKKLLQKVTNNTLESPDKKKEKYENSVKSYSKNNSE